MRCLLVLSLASSALVLSFGNVGAATKRPTAVGVAQREYSIELYRSSVPPGKVSFNVHNFGQDVHNLVVKNSHGRRVGYLKKISAGESLKLEVTLKRRGRYTVLCNLANHQKLGMRARLKVK